MLMMQASEMTQAFRHLDRRGVGKILVVDALRAVRGEVNARRARAIDAAFDSLLFKHGDDGHNSDTLKPATIAKLFRVEAHPDVVSGARAQGEVLSEFLEAFEGKSSNGRCWPIRHFSDIDLLQPQFLAASSFGYRCYFAICLMPLLPLDSGLRSPTFSGNLNFHTHLDRLLRYLPHSFFSFVVMHVSRWR